MLKVIFVGAVWTARFPASPFAVETAPKDAADGLSGATGHTNKHRGISEHRVGSEITPAALSHHRTCGSAYGGSLVTLKAPLGVQQRDQTHGIEGAFREGRIHVRCARAPPRTLPVTGRVSAVAPAESVDPVPSGCPALLPRPQAWVCRLWHVLTVQQRGLDRGPVYLPSRHLATPVAQRQVCRSPGV